MSRVAYDVFYDEADGIRSQQGWYYANAQSLICGPFHSQHAAEYQAQCDQEETD